MRFVHTLDICVFLYLLLNDTESRFLLANSRLKKISYCSLYMGREKKDLEKFEVAITDSKKRIDIFYFIVDWTSPKKSTEVKTCGY